jgi:hypothetical protein
MLNLVMYFPCLRHPFESLCSLRCPARQCHPGLSGGRYLPDTLLPVAPAVSALWGRRSAAPPNTPDPLAAASDPGTGTCGPGLRVAVADAWARPDRGAIIAAPVGRLADQRLGGLRDPQAARLGDPLGVAHAIGGPRGNGRPADRAHPVNELSKWVVTFPKRCQAPN